MEQHWNIIQQVCIYALPVLLAITVRQVAYGYVARYFGDRTAEQSGRLSLNPLLHIEPIGTVLLPLLSIVLHAPMVLGWAKAMPVDFRNLRSPKADMFWVVLAGSASNLLMALMWLALFKLALSADGNYLQAPLHYMSQAGVQINIMLMVFNLLPIPPLDGGRILMSILPPRAAMTIARIEPFGFMIVMVLMMTGILWHIMQPFISSILHLFDLFL